MRDVMTHLGVLAGKKFEPPRIFFQAGLFFFEQDRIFFRAGSNFFPVVPNFFSSRSSWIEFQEGLNFFEAEIRARSNFC